ncbi:lysophospholipid acyltransferase family protein [Paractinoplanes rishiriensis]|uniref:1-acyl-sn-glycerol-3-phosphate acyltransferase n=1 Tax=Paractinoplanes rishiriensis TaxID=1050105 RepID=A0A919MU62_9ACTN|nr:lysophospholipid acyltransferase family protein [Actinoplanes rishiriensis]GIE95004.1 1-acyl-sn-glycerol-3-phosphate acyltransferase [Actinoplanes rishiriensis]
MLASALRPVLLPAAHLAFRPDVHGAAHVPRTGAVILAANHLSVLDSFLIPLMTPRRVSFLAKEEHFRHWPRRTFLTAVDAIPVPRGGFRAAQDALDAALRVLDGGGAFGIHPEGSRSRDGRLYRGRTGVGWLALASGAPVVPVAVQGTEKIQPVGARLPRFGRVTVRFGTPLRFAPPPDGKQARARRAATDQIMDAIAELSGQQRANEYNELSGGPPG